MKGRITSILEEFQNRTSKAGAPYSASKVEVELENGELATILSFNDLPIGSDVELEKKGEYWNIVSKKQAAENAKHDEIMKGLRANYALLKQIEARIARLEGEDVPDTTPPPKPAQTASQEPTSLSAKFNEVRAAKAEKQDEVYPVSDDEEVDLSGIPF